MFDIRGLPGLEDVIRILESTTLIGAGAIKAVEVVEQNWFRDFGSLTNLITLPSRFGSYLKGAGKVSRTKFAVGVAITVGATERAGIGLRRERDWTVVRERNGRDIPGPKFVQSRN